MSGLGRRFAEYVSLNVLGMIGLSCYILADTFFIANGVGPNGLTALNIAIPVYNLVNGLGLMIGMGGATRYSILRGESSNKKETETFSQCVNLAAILGVISIFVGLFASELLARQLGADVQVLNDTTIYIKVILLFAPMFLFNNLLNAFVRNDGNPRLAMAAMMSGSIANIFLDYVMIYPLGLGMFGAVLATGLAPCIGIGVLSIHFLRRKNGFSYIFQPLRISLATRSINLGLASLITEVSFGIVILVFNLLILRLTGNIGVAAYGIIANLAFVVTAIFTGIAQGMQPIISDCQGRGDQVGGEKIYRYGLLTAIVFSILVYSIFFLQAEGVTSLFNSSADLSLRQIAVGGIRIYFLGYLFAGMNIVSAAYFSSTGYAGPSFVIAILRGLGLILPIVVVFSMLFGMTGVWLSFPTTEIIVFIVAMILKYRQRCSRKTSITKGS